MFTLKTSNCFDSAHFLKGYEGKCGNIHGHRWKVEVEIYGEVLDEAGSTRSMLVDFSTFKDDLKVHTDALDHVLIIERGSLKESTKQALAEENFRVVEVDFRPTAECFAKYFYDKMKADGYSVKSCTVYETPNNCATYTENI